MDHIIECPKHNGRFDYRTGEGKGRADPRQPEDVSGQGRQRHGQHRHRLNSTSRSRVNLSRPGQRLDSGGTVRGAHREDDQVDAGIGVLGGTSRPWPTGRRLRPHQVHRTTDLRRVASDCCASLVEDVAGRLPLSPGCRARRGPTCRPSEPRPAGCGSDRCRRSRSGSGLHRLGLAAGVGQLVVVAAEVGVLVGQQRRDHLEALVEAVEALLQCAEWDAVGVGLRLEPSGAEAEVEATAGDVVEGDGRVRR